MINESDDAIIRQRDIEHQQLRILILISEVASIPGNASKLDGLTKLAKLDFLTRYPAAQPLVADVLDGFVSERNRVIHLSPDLPMMRYKFGPWDDRYYPVLGALVGRGLASYAKGRRGGVAISLSPQGRKLIKTLRQDSRWSAVFDSYHSVASQFGLETGNRLKEAIYTALPAVLNVPHRTVIQ